MGKLRDPLAKAAADVRDRLERWKGFQQSMMPLGPLGMRPSFARYGPIPMTAPRPRRRVREVIGDVGRKGVAIAGAGLAVGAKRVGEHARSAARSATEAVSIVPDLKAFFVWGLLFHYLIGQFLLDYGGYLAIGFINALSFMYAYNIQRKSSNSIISLSF